MKPDFDQIYYIYQQWVASLDEIADVDGLGPTFVLSLMPASAAAVALDSGVGNTWALDANPYIIFQTSTGWLNADDDARIISWSQTFLTRMHEENQAKGLATNYLYTGDTGDWQDPYVLLPDDPLD